MAEVLFSASIPASLLVFYICRAWWIARKQWTALPLDTKIIYFAVAPVLTLAVDVLQITDRLFYTPVRLAAKDRRALLGQRLTRVAQFDASLAEPNAIH